MLPLTDFPISFAQPWQALPTQQPALLPWVLTLQGAVEQPQQLSYQQLLQLPQSYQLRRIVSEQGWSYKVAWHGVLLKQLLPLVSLQQSASYVLQSNQNGQQQLLPLKDLLEQEALLVTHLENDALHPAHGGPLRLISFSHTLEASIPQVTSLTFVSKASKEEQAAMKERLIQPSKVYAYDLKTLKTIEKAGEVKAF
jgi:DMSO/TMAO reductase YedYZ molybdopterin-dependent catalytic subunit